MCFCSMSDTSLNIDEHLVMSYYADEVTEQETSALAKLAESLLNQSGEVAAADKHFSF